MAETVFPNATMPRLDVLAGVWSTHITMLDDTGAEAEVFTATGLYRWKPGSDFLVHDVEAHMCGEPVRSMEIIGIPPMGKATSAATTAILVRSAITPQG